MLRDKEDIVEDIFSQRLHHSPILRSESGKTFFYYGFRPSEDNSHHEIRPVFFGFTDMSQDSESRFVRLNKGALHFDQFLHLHSRFETIDDRFVQFPEGPKTYFGVFYRENRKLDLQTTRELFGLSFPELQSLVGFYEQAFHDRDSHDYRGAYPRVTFSRRRQNHCDLSGALIPINFPYIAFDTSGSQWSHVSLYSFYQHIHFLCYDKSTPFYKFLIKEGVEPDPLNNILNNDIRSVEIIRANSR